MTQRVQNHKFEGPIWKISITELLSNENYMYVSQNKRHRMLHSFQEGLILFSETIFLKHLNRQIQYADVFRGMYDAITHASSSYCFLNTAWKGLLFCLLWIKSIRRCLPNSL